jgi:hypothetical protein
MDIGMLTKDKNQKSNSRSSSSFVTSSHKNFWTISHRISQYPLCSKYKGIFLHSKSNSIYLILRSENKLLKMYFIGQNVHFEFYLQEILDLYFKLRLSN